MSSDSKLLKLHLGCGERVIPGWFHVDQCGAEHIDLQTDVSDLSGIEDESCLIVYASHVLEYFDWEQAKKEVLPEWRRVLAKGGLLRVSVPDFGAISRLYQADLPLSWFVGPLYGRMLVNGKWVYHRCVYDERTLKALLLQSGFTNFRFYDWKETEHADIDDCSKGYIPHMRDEGILLSLNVEVDKSGL